MKETKNTGYGKPDYSIGRQPAFPSLSEWGPNNSGLTKREILIFMLASTTLANLRCSVEDAREAMDDTLTGVIYTADALLAKLDGRENP